ncbi:hypothetical protein LA080_001991 [Diaporthe eres]|uniref:Ppe family protein n=1 Tax=Diaporthe vaccinii TaxID=105482 RepID=A0ABR4F9S6_9PEZI|nr:hypothetical protein LA080_001991 [Diaporthe eres]
MKASFILASAALQGIAVTALPVTLAGELLSARDLDAREPATKALGGGGKGESVPQAANAFAGDVAVVSSSLNGMGTTTDQNQIRTMARKAFAAEKDEDQHRAVLDDAAGRDARQANQKIVDNTPIVLDGLQSMMKNPSMANVMKQLSKVESARNANILPSITQLSNSALQNTGSDQKAKKFDPTTGTQSLKQLMASGTGDDTGAATNANAGSATNKGGAAGTGNTAAKGSNAGTTGKGKGTAAGAGTATQKGGADATTGNTGAKGGASAATTGKGKDTAAGAGTANQKGGGTGTGNTAAKGSAPAATTGKGKGTAAAGNAAGGNAASKGGGAAKGGAGTAAATTGNTSTKGAGAGTKGAGNAAAADDNAATTTKGAAGKGKTNGAGGNAAAADDEDEDN